MKPLPDATQHLGEAEAEEVFGWILDGETSDEEIARFLVDMSARSETSDEIAGAARALRVRLIPIAAPEGTVDCCGTGGDGHHTLNVSTAVSLVVAACGVPVAKHGNRAASSKSGAADTLEALGLESTAYGQPVERYQMLTTMTDGMLRSLALSIVICLGLLVALRRSWVEGIEAIIPVVLVTAWVYGTIWALGWSLNLVTVSIAAITIGVGVDFAVHLLHRYREALADGEPPEEAMHTAVRHAGTPITGAALTTAAGFGVLSFSPMTSFSQFGMLTAVMILYALIATLLVLPAVVLTVAEYRAAPAFPR